MRYQFLKTVVVDGTRFAAGDVVYGTVLPAGSLRSLLRCGQIAAIGEEPPASPEPVQPAPEPAPIPAKKPAKKTAVKKPAPVEVQAPETEPATTPDLDPEPLTEPEADPDAPREKVDH